MLGRLVVPCPVTVEVAGRGVVVPAAPAAVWLEAVSSDDPVRSVVPGMLDGEDHASVVLAMLGGRLDDAGLERAFCQVLADVSGRPWWEAMRLIGNASTPEVWGHLLLNGVDATRVTLAGFCAAVHALVTQHMDEKARNQFDFDLKLPPAGVEAEPEGWDTVVW